MVTTVKQHNTRFRLNYAEVGFQPLKILQMLPRYATSNIPTVQQTNFGLQLKALCVVARLLGTSRSFSIAGLTSANDA